MMEILIFSLSIYLGSLLIYGGMMLNLVPSSMLLWPVNTKRSKNVHIRNDNIQISTSCKFPETSEHCQDKICTTGLDRMDPAGQEWADTSNLQLGEEQLPAPENHKCSEAPQKDILINNEENNQARSQAYFSGPKEKKSRDFPFKQCHLDFSQLKNPFFYLFTWSFLFSQLAYFVPTFHLAARAKTLAIDPMDTAYIISVAGKENATLLLKCGVPMVSVGWTQRYSSAYKKVH